MSEPKYEQCGWQAPHKEHLHGIFSAFTCKGVPQGAEYVVIARHIMKWSVLRDEVVPAIQRSFPGVIVDADECVIYSTIPDQEWRGASIKIIGLEYRTAESYVRALVGEFGLWDDNRYPDIRPVNEHQAQRLIEHRERIRK